jgi:hypothetical protein
MASNITLVAAQALSRPAFDFATVIHLMADVGMLAVQIQTTPVGGTVQTPPESAVGITLSDGKRCAVTLVATREALSAGTTRIVNRGRTARRALRL